MKRAKFLACLGLTLVLAACEGPGNVDFFASDGDSSEAVEVADADLPDADLPDGDLPDGDPTDGDPTDGDTECPPYSCTPYCDGSIAYNCQDAADPGECLPNIPYKMDCNAGSSGEERVCDMYYEAVCVPIAAASCKTTGPLLLVEPDGSAKEPFAFGPLQLGEQGKRVLLLRNTGARPLALSTLELTPDSSPDFALEAPPALPLTIEAGADLGLVVSYTQRAEAVQKASLTIVSDSCALPKRNVPLASVMNGQSRLYVNRTTVDFGAVPPGVESIQYLRIANPQPASCDPTLSPPPELPCNKPLAIWNFKIEGPDAATFSIQTPVPTGDAAPLLIAAGKELKLKLAIQATTKDCREGYRAELSFDEDADVNSYGALNAPMKVSLRSVCK